jgi:type I restriction-modification system DNA methylase subunit
MEKETVAKLRLLVKDFASAEKKGLSFDDPEGDTERLYIEPLFEALGWNMRSREVRTQREAGKSGKRTDYSFWIERHSRFIAEAKASSVSLDGYYTDGNKKVPFSEKTLEYAWNTNVTCGVLLNFKEIRVYNATVKVDDPEKAYLFPPIRHFEIIDRINDLWLLSKEAVEKGILEETIRKQIIEQSLPVRTTIDKDILDSLVRWRRILALDIGEKYKHSYREMQHLQEIVQRIIDRVVFIRVLEDLNLEKMDGLWQIATGTEKPRYKKLVRLFEYMDKYYNSMLFSKSLADSFDVSDSVIETVIKDSYKYKFDRIPLDLFGIFYENYIGFILNEEKEFVKSKGETQAKGIYYTSPYIVDLICSLTLKEKLQTLKPVKGKLPVVKILDPACGSGSFTMRAFDELVSWYNSYFEKDDIRLDFEEKKRLLIENIFGVDLDRQAIEVASTYHLIGLLKGVSTRPLFLPSMTKEKRNNYYEADEIHEELPLYQRIYQEKRESIFKSLHKLVEEGAFHLPTMMGEHSTIRHGNSLISASARDLKRYFGTNYQQLIYPFDWYQEYPDVFGQDIKDKGFDIIIGNPPYRNMDEPKEGEDTELFSRIKSFYQEYASSKHGYLSWKDCYRRMSDIYYFFFFRSISLLTRNGILGYITSRSYLEAHYADNLRAFILRTCKVKYIIDFGDVRVFDKASITTAITVLEREPEKKKRDDNKIIVVKVKQPFSGINFQDSIRLLVTYISQHIDRKDHSDNHIDVFDVLQKTLTETPWNFLKTTIDDIYKKIDSNHPKLKDICHVGQGMQTAANEVFCEFTWDDILSKGLEQPYVYKRAVNSDIEAYQFNHSGNYAIYIEDISANNNDDLSNIPRNIKKWLLQNRIFLEDRAAYKRGDCLWFKYSFPLHKGYYHFPKIICPYRAEKNRFYIDEDAELKVYTDTTVIFPKDSDRIPLLKGQMPVEEALDLHYILGLLNSSLLTFRYKGIGKLTSKGIYEYFWNQIGRLPIKVPDFENNQEVELYNLVRNNAKEIQNFYKIIQKMPETFKKRKDIMAKIEILKKQIDEGVETLYGVTL